MSLQSNGDLKSLTKSVSEVSLKDAKNTADNGIDESPRTVTGNDCNTSLQQLPDTEQPAADTSNHPLFVAFC